MAEETQQDGQKTLVAFVVGLLIGGMLVWAFSGPTADAPQTATPKDDVAENEEEDNGEVDDTRIEATDTNQETSVVETPVLEVGEGSITVNDQLASNSIVIESAIYPVSEGWVGVRAYTNDKLGSILGVVRFSESQGLVPTEIALLQPTTPGNRYAVVVFTEDGDFDFGLAGDVQIDTIFDTFIAQ